MEIPLCDIRASDAPYRDEIDDAIKRVIDNSSFILGKEVEAFEQEFAKYIGVKHCIGVSSCTAALHLSMVAVGQNEGAGDGDGVDVAVPVRTVTADIEAIRMFGADYVFYDYKWQMDSDINIVVHLYGTPNKSVCNYDSEDEDEEDCLLEDCAQATGATINGKMCGTFGDISCFSFFPSKVLGCYGDGGAVCTDNDVLAERIRALRNHGRKQGEKHKHDYVGYNYRLDGLQAAILRVKLKYIETAIDRRREIAKLYNKHLAGIVDIPVEPPECKAVYYTYSIECDRRDDLRAFLKSNGISTGLHYPIPLHRQPAYSNPKYNFPEADLWAARTLSLPMYPALEEEQVKYICQKIGEFYS